ncbi:triphosphoribosyl-dephospho-CoA synthase [Schlesneria sp.]|uniref:triphosphoribosyl-dephospho-CoA synthase n=1 Tax=Schlesneria sp. TaxID=2762018 RepID=UPI002EF0145C
MTLAEQIEIACLMEATARKPGNVHPAAAFSDLTYNDFVCAAKAVAAPLAALAPSSADTTDVGPGGSVRTSSPVPPRLGAAIFNAVRATRDATGTNVNLGIILLLAPLVAVPHDVPLEEGIGAVLDDTTTEDAGEVYAAIRLALPGGMGEASSQDIREQPTVTLREAMHLAVDRDRIAEQYCTNYRLVFAARRKLADLFLTTTDWEQAVVLLHVWMMAEWPDTLIARKCGWDIARESATRAAAVLTTAVGSSLPDRSRLAELDCWLRADGHRRNPGTTADLVAAALFAAVRDGLIPSPTRSAITDRANLILTATAETTI